MKFSYKLIILLAFGVMPFAACEKVDVFERNIPLQDQHWHSSVKPEISFTISDAASRYNIFVVIRHSDAYRYNNLWVNIYTQAPGDSIVKPQALDLQLASNEKGWLGSGMDDIYEHRIKISQSPVSLKAGTYRFQLEQIMRDDPLENILNIGIRVERAPN
ncbi:gliding motility lipoprotein GldH [Flavihumibacter profundi]|uniref:gliding motility lipoprotein GldH n=1 Tax=Flavihumibacter profundi TaxID=2716883 RepID=UPI001CC34BBA|nr:gliding motility lipoprotein GldH [Flavihumibacter profundi]MBZ5857898.1 gliding motility lipoprotein GldH [Flavihumibacter profundi]